MGGTIKVNSVYGKGSMFTIRIPQKIVDKEPIGNIESAYEKADMEALRVKQHLHAPDVVEPENSKIDKSIGLNYCGGSEDMYREIVKAYHQQSAKYVAAIAQLCEKAEWKGYAVIAHAIKSTSLTIGAKELSEEAKTQELAAKEGKTEVCEQGWRAFLESYQQILQEVENYLGIEESQEKTEEPVQLLSKEEYTKECRQLLQYIRDYEMGEAMEQIEKMFRNSVSQEEREQEITYLKKIRAAVDEFEYDLAEELVTEWLDKQEAL